VTSPYGLGDTGVGDTAVGATKEKCGWGVGRGVSVGAGHEGSVSGGNKIACLEGTGDGDAVHGK
jgi:hypothetical protein